MKRILVVLMSFSLVSILALTPGVAAAKNPTFIGKLKTISSIASTVPANGDINPYGVALVPRSMGKLVKGDILVSNFNNSQNQQGTGTTLVQISPKGDVSLFAAITVNDLKDPCPGGIGLTTALAVFRTGWVIVGSLPTKDGTSATAEAGCLIVLNSSGHVVETISGEKINGPWDMTAIDGNETGTLFISNVLNGTVAASPNTVNKGDIVRIRLMLDEKEMPRVMSRTVIASGFGERTDPDALVIGPTGLGLARNGTLYVADTLASRIAAIPEALTRVSDAGTGRTVSEGKALNNPLGLAIASDGHILAANAGDGNLVEVTPGGMQVAVKNIDTTGAGAGTLFGLAVAHKGVFFVNDGNNTLNFLH